MVKRSVTLVTSEVQFSLLVFSGNRFGCLEYINLHYPAVDVVCFTAAFHLKTIQYRVISSPTISISYLGR